MSVKQKSTAYKVSKDNLEYTGTIDYISKKLKMKPNTIVMAATRDRPCQGWKIERLGYYVSTYKVYQKEWKYVGRKDLLEVEDMGYPRRYVSQMVKRNDGVCGERKFIKQKKRKLIYDKFDCE